MFLSIAIPRSSSKSSHVAFVKLIVHREIASTSCDRVRAESNAIASRYRIRDENIVGDEFLRGNYVVVCSSTLEMAKHSLRPILILIMVLQVQRRAIGVQRERTKDREASNLKVRSIVSLLQTVLVISSVLAT